MVDTYQMPPKGDHHWHSGSMHILLTYAEDGTAYGFGANGSERCTIPGDLLGTILWEWLVLHNTDVQTYPILSHITLTKLRT